MPSISLCMIVRELGTPGLYQCLATVGQNVDEVWITVASDTPPSAEACAAFMRHFPDGFVKVGFFEWCDDFAAARNASFQNATGDWLFWLDDDDLVEGADQLRGLVDEAEKRGIGSYHLEYRYRHDEVGNCTVTHNRERLLKRSLGWTWKDRVHEFCNAATEHVVGFSDDVVVVHTTNAANSERNMRLLEMMEAEDPENQRMLGSMADIHQSTGDFPKAIEYYKKLYQVAEVSVLQWHCAAELARCYQKLRRWDESIEWALGATAIHPEYSLPYLLIAHAYWFGKRDAGRALRYLEDANSREEAPLTTMRLPADYTLNRWNVEHRVLNELGRYDEALALVQQALEMTKKPGEQMLPYGEWQYWMWFYVERRQIEASVKAAWQLVDHLFRRGDTLRALRLLEQDLPLSVREDSRMLTLLDRVRGLTHHVFDQKAYVGFYESNHSSLDDHDALMNGTDVETYRMNVLLKRLRARGASRILDVGCGAGEPAIWLAEHGFYVTGLDINSKAIEEARRRWKKKGNTIHQNGAKALRCEFRTGSLDSLGPEDLGKFDAVVMMELIEHLNPVDVPFYLSSAEDFLAPGGAVFMTTPGMAVGDIPGVWQEFPRDHVQEFSRADLEGLILQSGSRRLKRIQSLHKVFDPAVSVPGFASWFIEYEWKAADAPVEPEWEKPIVIYLGPHVEEWNADTPDEVGIGGSETWAAKVSRELRKKGHPVVVYATVNEVRDGVIWRDAALYDPKAPFLGAPAWLTVISRRLKNMDIRPDTEHLVFVAHDVDYESELTAERLENMDIYAVMSEWQRQHTIEKYPDLPIADKLAVVANGIEPSFFEATPPASGEAPDIPSEPIPAVRIPRSFIWSSSPDRGLDILLEWWPHIKEMWDDATLDIFYGWEYVEASFEGRPWLRNFKAKCEALADATEGVTFRGRIGQRELAQEMQKHQFWLYPSWNVLGVPWHETYCITALEAQAGGCIPIVPNSGAIPERFYFGTLIDDEKMELPEVLEALQWWDRTAAQGVLTINDFLADGQARALSNDWTAAADKLLACVREEVTV